MIKHNATNLDKQQAIRLFKRHNILIVEDDPVIRKEFCGMMKIVFNDVFVAEDGFAGLELFKQKQSEISLIISDFNMPIMNGVDMFKQIRKIDTNISLVMLTGGGVSEDYFVDLVKAGLDSYILKPIQVNTTFAILYDILIAKEQSKIIHEQKKELEVMLSLLGEHNLVTKTNPQGVITYANDIFCEISGYERDEVIGKPHNIVRHPDMQAETFKELWETIKSGNIWKGRVKNKSKSGSSYIVNSMVMPLFNANGDIEEFVSSRHIITEEVEQLEKISTFNSGLKKGYIEAKSEITKIKRELEADYKNRFNKELALAIDAKEKHFIEAQKLAHEQLKKEKDKTSALVEKIANLEKEVGTTYDKTMEFNKKLKEATAKENERATKATNETNRVKQEMGAMELKMSEMQREIMKLQNEVKKEQHKYDEMYDLVKYYERNIPREILMGLATKKEQK